MQRWNFLYEDTYKHSFINLSMISGRLQESCCLNLPQKISSPCLCILYMSVVYICICFSFLTRSSVRGTGRPFLLFFFPFTMMWLRIVVSVVVVAQCNAFSSLGRSTAPLAKSEISKSAIQSPLFHSSIVTRLAMSGEAAKDEDAKASTREKSPAQKAKSGILLLPLLIKFIIVMAIKLLTDLVVLPILIIIRSPVWFPKFIKRIFGKNEINGDGETEALSWLSLFMCVRLTSLLELVEVLKPRLSQIPYPSHRTVFPAAKLRNSRYKQVPFTKWSPLTLGNFDYT